MLRATEVIQAGGTGHAHVMDTITLDRHARWRRRIAMTTDGGRDFLLDLAEATYLAHGAVLKLTDGSLIEVRAQKEKLVEIHAHSAGELARIAWHIGNRHVAAEINDQAIYIQPDHVLEDMVKRHGGHVHHVMRPFEPEAGAYGHKGALHAGHSHGTAHGDDHAHGHGHAHGDGHRAHHHSHNPHKHE
jgi:urease accessory protein